METDQALWEKVLNSHPSALDAIYFRYADDLYDYGMKISNDEAMVEDVIQDIFVDLWNKRKTLGTIEYLKTYLLVALKRRLLRKMQQQKRMDTYQNPGLQESYDFQLRLVQQPSVLRDMEQADRKEKIAAVLLSLTPKQREAIFLKYYQGLSYSEISEILNIETKAVYKLMARALSTLKSNISLKILMGILILVA